MPNQNKQVRLKEETLSRLKLLKNTPRESYDEIITRIILNSSELRSKVYAEEINSKHKEDLEKIAAWNKYISEMEAYFIKTIEAIKKGKPANLDIREPPSFPSFKSVKEIMSDWRFHNQIPIPKKKIYVPKVYIPKL